MNVKWSNEQVLEFIELLYRAEALWNLANKCYKNKNVLADSWERIRRRMCVADITVANLKKSLYNQALVQIKFTELIDLHTKVCVHSYPWVLFLTAGWALLIK